MKKMLSALVLATLLPALAQAGGGFYFFPSSTTAVGELVSSSSVTAANFIGDGYNITGMTIGASSSAVNGGSFSVASATDISIATVTASLRGSRIGAVVYTIDLVNNSGGVRDYTLSYIENGVTHDTHTMTLPIGDSGQIGDMHFLAPTPDGINNFTFNMRTSNATGSQTANHAKISVIEW